MLEIKDLSLIFPGLNTSTITNNTKFIVFKGDKGDKGDQGIQGI
jgi:hypothetical protein